ncbi:tRNA lysidine(34) synthetase TilS [Mangrovihabitans endophyticus]|uniref:tRNA(Ile)-lysidine synthase n=1 Tax=Mangrovihabitans endophyticus TaxID=1751298 RepID=A0A8J3C3B0_9ACTN|nr:tRNA lysidine(34) synthetase TilS [Mangrovihabitans endophyticus]GGL03461.1 tRNA(Ile)-lysidine synthase [Mangrovihabitans endophyticus]
MARIPAPVAAVRTAVRRSLTGLPSGGTVLVACSGGPDSLALAAATAFVAPRSGLRPGLVTVDHRLQEGSTARADAVATWARSAGCHPVEAVSVDVGGLPGGPEAAARSARYAALQASAARWSAVAVLLGHTRDDQAETVLLALARGAGPRGLSGMPRRRGVFLRPLLDVSRAQTHKACSALGLPTWADPHNADPAFARTRVRGGALPALVEALGPAVVDNLARTATQLAADNAVLDELAARARETAETADVRPGAPAPALSVPVLAGLAPAVRTRLLHAWARGLGAPGGDLSHRHVDALDALITDWHGQGVTALPGGIGVVRRDGVLLAEYL